MEVARWVPIRVFGKNKKHKKTRYGGAKIIETADQTCNYIIAGSDRNGEWTLFTETGKGPSFGKSLENIQFFRTDSDPSPKCSLRYMTIKHGKVINDDKVPYFLAGATVSIRCKDGYHVNGPNHTPYQEVKCSKELRSKPCVTITIFNYITSRFVTISEFNHCYVCLVDIFFNPYAREKTESYR